jgi:glycolate oxidase iron-sulfur subunit
MIPAYLPEPPGLDGSAGITTLLRPLPAPDGKTANLLPATAALPAAAHPGTLMPAASSVGRSSLRSRAVGRGALGHRSLGRCALGRRGGRIALAHTVEALDASIRGLPLESLPVCARSAPNQGEPLGEATSTTPFLPKTR